MLNFIRLFGLSGTVAALNLGLHMDADHCAEVQIAVPELGFNPYIYSGRDRWETLEHWKTHRKRHRIYVSLKKQDLAFVKDLEFYKYLADQQPSCGCSRLHGHLRLDAEEIATVENAFPLHIGDIKISALEYLSRNYSDDRKQEMSVTDQAAMLTWQVSYITEDGNEIIFSDNRKTVEQYFEEYPNIIGEFKLTFKSPKRVAAELEQENGMNFLIRALKDVGEPVRSGEIVRSIFLSKYTN